MDRLTYYLDEQRTMLAMPQRKPRIELYVKTLAELEDKIEGCELVAPKEILCTTVYIVRSRGIIKAQIESIEFSTIVCKGEMFVHITAVRYDNGQKKYKRIYLRDRGFQSEWFIDEAAAEIRLKELREKK